jgi:hypothetical protein
MGHTYTLDEWRVLPIVCVEDEYDPDATLTIRRCGRCSTTVSREVRYDAPHAEEER